jgi:hypothetical protein
MNDHFPSSACEESFFQAQNRHQPKHNGAGTQSQKRRSVASFAETIGTTLRTRSWRFPDRHIALRTAGGLTQSLDAEVCDSYLAVTDPWTVGTIVVV